MPWTETARREYRRDCARYQSAIPGIAGPNRDRLPMTGSGRPKADNHIWLPAFPITGSAVFSCREPGSHDTA